MSDNLPEYRSQKVVRAAKIISVTRAPGDNQPYELYLEGDFKRTVDEAWAARQCVWSSPGGYFVEYEDGYTSWLPAKAFKEGYSAIKSDPRLSPNLTATQSQFEAMTEAEVNAAIEAGKTEDPRLPCSGCGCVEMERDRAFLLNVAAIHSQSLEHTKAAKAAAEVLAGMVGHVCLRHFVTKLEFKDTNKTV